VVELFVALAFIVATLALLGLVAGFISFVFGLIALPFKLLGGLVGMLAGGLVMLILLPILFVGGLVGMIGLTVGFIALLVPALPIVLLVALFVWLARRPAQPKRA
jgi:hypothetical protein